MNTHFYLRVLRKIFFIFTRKKTSPILPSEMSVSDDEASDLIYKLLERDEPCMIARYGSYELKAMINSMDVTKGKHEYFQFIKGKNLGWWYDKKLIHHLCHNAGFYPMEEKQISKFSDRMYEDTKQLDLLGSFCRYESLLQRELEGVKKIPLKLLEPFYGKIPWTKALQGKRVLVVHPLARQIQEQYSKNRRKLFPNKEILPEFELLTIEAVQSLGGKNDKFNTWFEALEWMENQISKQDFDICLVGCGAYGFCLAAYVKRIGKKAVHLGGVLQLLFGIQGNRWDDPYYNVEAWKIPIGFYSSMPNKYWVRPNPFSIPKNSAEIENACYW